MADNTQPDTTKDSRAQARAALIRRGRQRYAFAMLTWGVLLFVAAGTLGWARGWLNLVLLATGLRLKTAVLRRVNPAVLLARLKNNQPVTGFDRRILPVFRLGLMSIPLMAGLDAVCGHWTAMSAWWILPGIVLQAAGSAIITWAMAVNPFLEEMVRIQSERGHRVISSGPYRIVRHPMYVGCGLLFAAMPLELGSWWALAPAAVATLALAVRAGFEDALLRRELPGYEDFTRQTPYRMLPGIW